MEKISASYISDKGLVSKIYKVLLNLNNKKKIIQFFKWTKGLFRHFSREYIQTDNKQWKGA